MADDIVKVKIDTDTKDSVKSVLAYTAVIGGATVAINKTIKVAKEWSKAASDAEETASKFFTVFKDLTPEATDAMNDLADSFGLADSSAQKMLGDTGDLLTGFGFTQQAALDLSSQVNSLAIDLASFTNFAGGSEGASQALTKALLGETESAKSLGIVIRQDSDEYKNLMEHYQKVEGASLNQAKAMTVLKIATNQSKNAIGDYARTADGFANTQRRLQESTKQLKEELGKSVNEGVLPFMQILSTATSALADYIGKMDEANVTAGKFRVGGGAGSRTLAGDLEADAKAQEAHWEAMNNRGKQFQSNQTKILEEAEAKREAIRLAKAEALAADFAKKGELAGLSKAAAEEENELNNKYAEARIEAIDRENQALQDQADFEQQMFEQRLNAASTFFNGFAALAQLGAEKSYAAAIAFKALSSAEALIASYTAADKALNSVPYPWNIAAFSGVLAKGLATQARIVGTPIPKFANGGDFVTSGAQMIMVGDNATGRERVRVDPIGNEGSGGGDQAIVIPLTIDGNVIGRVMTKLSADGRMITSSRSVR